MPSSIVIFKYPVIAVIFANPLKFVIGSASRDPIMTFPSITVQVGFSMIKLSIEACDIKELPGQDCPKDNAWKATKSRSVNCFFMIVYLSKKFNSVLVRSLHNHLAHRTTSGINSDKIRTCFEEGKV